MLSLVLQFFGFVLLKAGASVNLLQYSLLLSLKQLSFSFYVSLCLYIQSIKFVTSNHGEVASINHFIPAIYCSQLRLEITVSFWGSFSPKTQRTQAYETIYRLAYSIILYCNILTLNCCIVIHIVSPDSCQYTVLLQKLTLGLNNVVYDLTLLSLNMSGALHVGDFLSLSRS